MSFLINPYWFGAAATDPNFANVSLLLHGDGLTITDSSSNAWTLSVTGAATSTADKLFGPRSILFNGVSGISQWVDASSSAGPSGSTDFTFEAFVNPSTLGGIDRIIFDSRLPSAVLDGNASTAGFAFFINTSGRLQVYDGGATALRTQSSASVTTGSWQHIALVKSGNTHTYFIGGSSSGSFTASNTSGPSGCRVGARNDQRFGFNGYIDELRITKGVARYTANFTPPTAPFPDS